MNKNKSSSYTDLSTQQPKTVDFVPPSNEQSSSGISNFDDKNKKENFFIEVFKFSLIILLIVLPFRMYVAKPFIVEGSSMSPTFETGNYLIVDQISYDFEKPKRGEVIVFKYPKDQTRFFIKRIVGLPTETVEIKNGNIIIFNQQNPKGLHLKENYVKHPQISDSKIKLGKDEYFVMGDNRANSSDSRIWGPVKKNLIIGRTFVRLLPINQIGLFPGSFNFQNSL